MQSTEQTIIETETIGAPFTPAGMTVILGSEQAQTLAAFVHGGGLAEVDYAPEDWDLDDHLAVTLEDGSQNAMGPDGVLTEL